MDSEWSSDRTKQIMDFHVTSAFAIEALMHRPPSYSGRPFSKYCRKVLACGMTLCGRNEGKG